MYAWLIVIEKEKGQFKITFTKSKVNREEKFKGETFAVCFKSGVSRYKPYNCPFVNIYNDIWQNYVEDEKSFGAESGPKKKLTIDSKKNNSHMNI